MLMGVEAESDRAGFTLLQKQKVGTLWFQLLGQLAKRQLVGGDIIIKLRRQMPQFLSQAAQVKFFVSV